jgi:hypothetical protein
LELALAVAALVSGDGPALPATPATGLVEHSDGESQREQRHQQGEHECNPIQRGTFLRL